MKLVVNLYVVSMLLPRQKQKTPWMKTRLVRFADMVGVIMWTVVRYQNMAMRTKCDKLMCVAGVVVAEVDSGRTLDIFWREHRMRLCLASRPPRRPNGTHTHHTHIPPRSKNPRTENNNHDEPIRRHHSSNNHSTLQTHCNRRHGAT